MGCDIHLHTEIKIKSEWHCYSSPDIKRWYKLFAKMANVRNRHNYIIEPLSEPKGLPDDISIITQLSYNDWEEDAHSMSWLNAEEIKELEDWLWEQHKTQDGYHYPEEEWGYLFGNPYSSYKDTPAEDIRFVFWFDN